MTNHVLQLTERQQALLTVALKQQLHGCKLAASDPSLAIELKTLIDSLAVNLPLISEEKAFRDLPRLTLSDY